MPFKERQRHRCLHAENWCENDFRFVQKEGRLYAFIMDTRPHRAAAIQSLKPEDQVFAVKLPGYGPVSFTQTAGVLFCELPEKKPTDYAGVLEIPSANNADHFRFYYYTEQPETGCSVLY